MSANRREEMQIDLEQMNSDQVPQIEVMTYRKCVMMALLSMVSTIFAIIAIFGFQGSEFVYLKQGATFSCPRFAHNLAVEHDHSFMS